MHGNIILLFFTNQCQTTAKIPIPANSHPTDIQTPKMFETTPASGHSCRPWFFMSGAD
jgi:hypothetical protein